jgi:hypothetical protein
MDGGVREARERYGLSDDERLDLIALRGSHRAFGDAPQLALAE